MKSLKGHDLLHSLKLLLSMPPAHPPSSLVPLSPGLVGRYSWAAPLFSWRGKCIPPYDSLNKAIVYVKGRTFKCQGEIRICIDRADLSLNRGDVDKQEWKQGKKFSGDKTLCIRCYLDIEKKKHQSLCQNHPLHLTLNRRRVGASQKPTCESVVEVLFFVLCTCL